MQRDLKIGLSLAVLLIGVVGALFFRRDNTEISDIPDLKMAWEIDQQILERKGLGIPYIAERKPEIKPASPESVITPAAEPRTVVSAPELATLPVESDSPKPPRAELIDVLPPSPDSMEMEVADSPRRRPHAAQVPDAEDPFIERPIARTFTNNVDLVQAERTQSLPKRWSNSRDDRLTGISRNQGWDSEHSIHDRSVPKPVPLPPADQEDNLETPTPVATRKLKPIPITEPGKFSRPGKTPFTLRSSSSETESGEGKSKPEENHPNRTDSTQQTNESTLAGNHRIYVVQPGDTLERIAYRQYGRRDQVEAILEANRDIVSDPHRISIGMKLRLP